MEALYQPSTYNSTDHIDIATYFEQYKSVCYGNFQDSDDKLYKVFKELGPNISDLMLHHLRDSCSVELLKDADDETKKPVPRPERIISTSQVEEVYKANRTAKKFNCVRTRLQLEEKMANQKRSFMGILGISCFYIPQAVSSPDINLSPGSDIIATIAIYRPMHMNVGIRGSEKVRISNIIEALGSNTLAEIRDKISCLADLGISKEMNSVKEDLFPYINAKKQYPSGSIFIDGIFYNDMRAPKSIDYAAKCIQWAAEKGIGNFQSALMEKTKVSDLKPRIGYPYVYKHQGNCEHILSFMDFRLLQDSDCLDSKCYPYVSTNVRRACPVCYLCNKFVAKWLCLDSDRLPQEKVYLCTNCCQSYNYIGTKKIGEFRLYPLFDSEHLSRFCDVDDD